METRGAPTLPCLAAVAQPCVPAGRGCGGVTQPVVSSSWLPRSCPFPHSFRKGPLSTAAGKAKLHEILHSLRSWLDWRAQCLCQGSTRAAWLLRWDGEGGGAVPQGAGELRAEEPVCSFGSCHEGTARDRNNRGHQLVSDLCVVFTPAYLYSP